MSIRRTEPGPGQESVWDYPRPPRIEPTARLCTVEAGGVTIVQTTRAVRVLETSQAPAYYFAPEDVDRRWLRPSDSRTFCEWKGQASYVDLVIDVAGSEPLVRPDAGWRYLHPTAGFTDITGYVSFYPSRVDRCTVDGEVVVPMDGDFYGGWITSDIVGPIKGARGTLGW